MKRILMSMALLWACVASSQAQESMKPPTFNSVTSTSGMPQVRTDHVKKKKRVRQPLIRCKDGTIHRNLGPACKGHGGVRR